MKIKSSQILFLIRAYNEGTRIGGVIEEIIRAGYTKILVIDDGSRDNTVKIAQSYPNIIVLSHAHNRGG